MKIEVEKVLKQIYYYLIVILNNNNRFRKILQLNGYFILNRPYYIKHKDNTFEKVEIVHGNWGGKVIISKWGSLNNDFVDTIRTVSVDYLYLKT